MVGVHSLDHFTIAVPDLERAREFYERFGLDVSESRGGLDLRARGSDHVWGHLREGQSEAPRLCDLRLLRPTT